MIEIKAESVTGLPQMGPFVEGGVLTSELLNKLYPLLQWPLPMEAAKHARKEQTKKQYDQTGYQVQFIVNRLNEVLGPAHYRFYYENETFEKGTWGSNKPCYVVNTDAILEFGNWEKGQFIPLARSIGAGGKTSDSMEDARKGARTSGRKLAAAGFGIGRKAYEGTLDADFSGPGGLSGNQGNGQPPQRNNQGNNGQPPQGNNRGYNGQPPQGNNRGYNGQPPQRNNQGNNGQQPQGNNQGNNGQPPQGNNRGYNGQPPQGNNRGNNGQQPLQGNRNQGNNGQPPNQGNRNQGNGQMNQGRNTNPAPDIFTGKIKLTADADVGSELTPMGEMACVKIYGITLDNRPVLVEGWGSEMLPLMADLAAGQTLMIQGAKTKLNTQNVLRIGLVVSNFSVSSVA